MNKLKRCPFCSRKAKLVIDQDNFLEKIYSLGCSAKICPAYKLFDTESGLSLQEAIDIWNHRPKENTLHEEIDRLQSIRLKQIQTIRSKESEVIDLQIQLLDQEHQVLQFDNMTLAQIEKIIYTSVLKKHNNNRHKAALTLQVGERTIYRKLKKYGMI